MDLKSLSTDELAAEIERRREVVKQAASEWQCAREATKIARRAETPLRNRYYEMHEALCFAQAEDNRREEILRNVGR